MSDVLAAAAEGYDPMSMLIDAGLLGVILVLLLLRKLVTKGELDNVIRERDQARAELTALRTSLDERVIPALTRSTDLLAKLESRKS